MGVGMTELVAIAGIFGTIVAGVTAALVTGSYNRRTNLDQLKYAKDMADAQRQHAERMATFEKRLEIHQELYSEAIKLYIAVSTSHLTSQGDKMTSILEFMSNVASRRLYLSETVHAALMASADEMEKIVIGEKSVDEGRAACKEAVNAILIAMDLPVIQQEGLLRRTRSRPPSPPE